MSTEHLDISWITSLQTACAYIQVCVHAYYNDWWVADDDDDSSSSSSSNTLSYSRIPISCLLEICRVPVFVLSHAPWSWPCYTGFLIHPFHALGMSASTSWLCGTKTLWRICFLVLDSYFLGLDVCSDLIETYHYLPWTKKLNCYGSVLYY